MKFVMAFASSLFLLLLASCATSGEESLSPPATTSQSESVQPEESAETEESTSSSSSGSSPEPKPSKKSTVESKAESSPEVAKPGSYLTLREYETSKERYVNADVVLFFNANWCSTCKIARDNIESSLDSIPSNLVIVVVDFDSEIDLRKTYGVTIQHTFVQVDKNGNQLAKWSGSVTAEEIAKKTI
jgi:thiol-disulfide isomerase/thioredoxin